MKPECPTCQWWNGARCLLTTGCQYSPRQTGAALASETPPTRGAILDAVKKTICQDRQDVHGNPEDTHALIADLWNTYISAREIYPKEGDGLESQDVAVMMALFKVARHAVNPKHTDNLHDAIGYLAIAAELQP